MQTRHSISVYTKKELCVYGKDLLKVRITNNMSRQAICIKMNIKGYCYYPMKLHRYEMSAKICLPETELIDLIYAIDSDFKIS